MDFSRYNRQIILKEFGIKGQKKLNMSKVLVIGAGGLGIPVLQYLNSMGIGTIGVVDGDHIVESNLHRQVIYNENQLGQQKVFAASDFLKNQNRNTTIKTFNCYLNPKNALEIIKHFDIIIDASDNFATRYLVNDSCVILNKPFIYGALHGFEGQVSVFNYKNGPTYRCLFPIPPTEDEIPNCNTQGVLGVLPGIVGNFQALECIKVITGIKKVLSGTLLIYDALSQEFHRFEVLKDSNINEIKVLQKNYELKCKTTFRSISSRNITKLITSNSIQIIDVRTPEECIDYPFNQALNIPLNALEKRIKEINFNENVYFLCSSGIRSKKAILILEKRHKTAKLIDISGGLKAISNNAS